jgi:D-alanyl-D-alanine carboxypeptidase (penicillin-binding protein 5/6)
MSARDIAVLAHYLIQKYPRILEIESKREYTFNGIKQYNRNPLLGSFEGADGLKTGWTEEAGYCLVGTAKQGDVRLISVVLNTKNEKERLEKSKELLTYGFKNFQFTKIKNAGDEVGTIEVKNGAVKTVPVKVDTNVSVFLPTADNVNVKDIKLVIKNNVDSLNAPFAAGVIAGKLEVQLNDQVLSSVDVYTTQEVKEASIFQKIVRWIMGMFGIR